MASIRRYGVPETVESDVCLRFKVGAFGEVQSLFAFDDTEEVPRLAGVVMFIRESTRSMLLLHLAIHQDYTYRGANAKAGVTAQLLNAVRKLSLRVRGVATLRMLYPRATQLGACLGNGFAAVGGPRRDWLVAGPRGHINSLE